MQIILYTNKCLSNSGYSFGWDTRRDAKKGDAGPLNPIGINLYWGKADIISQGH